MGKIKCDVCIHHCLLEEEQVGFCNGRANVNGNIKPVNYGMVTAIALDPIEKKPLIKFHPGSKILSIGSFGCNLRCPFCQNYEISMANIREAHFRKMMPDEIANNAARLVEVGNIGVAYTYNEPLIAWEFVRDCAQEVKKKGLKNVVVSNGCFEETVIHKIMPLIDAANIDLKAFNPEFYHRLKGDLEVVKNSIALMSESIHVEVTTLIIPDENDSLEEMEKQARWMASVSPKIPLHITRFFPRYHMQECHPTEVDKMKKLAEVAGEYLETVHLGNC